MKAIILKKHGGLENLVLEEIESPCLNADQVMIDVHACGVNFPDLLVISGDYQVLPSLPFIPGKDAVGVVSAVGKDVTMFKPGDRVLALMEYGGYAEQIVVEEENCYVIPSSMTFIQAAAMGLVYQTAHFALVDRGVFRPGEFVLVNGAAGGVGLAALQIAKGLGAHVLAGVISQEQARIAKLNGADDIIDLSVPELKHSLREQVRNATGGHGADVILDPIGGDVFRASLRALAWRGRMVVIGFAGGEIPEVKVNYLLLKNISLVGLQWSDYRDNNPERVRWVQQELFDLFIEGKIAPNIMATYPLEELANALCLLKTQRVQGKVVLTTKIWNNE